MCSNIHASSAAARRILRLKMTSSLPYSNELKRMCLVIRIVFNDEARTLILPLLFFKTLYEGYCLLEYNAV
jgi:hypothetical protein